MVRKYKISMFSEVPTLLSIQGSRKNKLSRAEENASHSPNRIARLEKTARPNFALFTH